VIVLDTSVLYALLDARDDLHGQARAWYDTVDEELVTTPLVLAETDHLTGARAGARALSAFRHDIEAGAYRVEWWATAAQDSAALAERYADLGLGLTDASLLRLCDRVETVRIATFDERHFRAIRPLSVGPAFQLLPIDQGPPPPKDRRPSTT
jgi:predicted nucleic acid-binding protein